ncbi:betaine aldehyde dehydrogenase [Daldinia decipiens]|uniref:betaine aldehyde dehydrogenase n=1 Tax=Daldinia decipiens TaxID=326647 RepID=UPI0020C2AD20|nr:betaine aldehyde dehydrogenase [Daldinia decipiens]KAI1652742.1 betaine aldehyde dehydrogenase [Daldinia decipiens]
MESIISFDKFYNIVNNSRVLGDKTYHGIDPSTGKTLWGAPIATGDDLDEAVAAANSAFKKWSSLQQHERSRFMRDLADALEKHKDALTELLGKESGKSVSFAESEVVMGINTMRRHADWSVPDQLLKDTEDVRIIVQHVPIGVVAGITPWNYPFQLAILKVAPALATGCTVILKPSPFTPYIALKIAEIAAEVLPPGVVQALGGDDNLGPWMTKHPGIHKISFTGSTATGKKIMAVASETLKRVNLELGGNDAAVVTEDFDVLEAAQLVAMATFAHSGQICMATKRIYVQESVYDEFMTHLVAIVKGYKPGEGFCSPIQNTMQFEKVKSIYDECEEQGFNFAVGGGSKVSVDDNRPGYFIAPAIVTNPPEKSRIVQEEPFGPIVPVLTWRDDDEVIRRVNDTPTGLGATIYCRDERRAWQISESLETGSVWVNSGLKLDPVALFGAHKQSGIGGELGPLGLKYYTNTRTITYWKDAPKGPQAKGNRGLFA